MNFCIRSGVQGSEVQGLEFISKYNILTAFFNLTFGLLSLIVSTHNIGRRYSAFVVLSFLFQFYYLISTYFFDAVHNSQVNQLHAISPDKEHIMERKILVVDDEDYQRELMQKLLSKLGYAVSVAESAETAFALLERERFPVIITDLIMLEMDGLEFCQKIMETDDKIVVIALTGHTDLYEPEKIRAAGFYNHLTKPFKIETIKQALIDGFKEFQRRVEA